VSIGGDPTVVVPALTNALKDSGVNVRWNAPWVWKTLGAAPGGHSRFENAERPRHGRQCSITQAVATALWRIAPERPPSVDREDATALITDGVTTEAVKFLFHGKRDVLVPISSAVPVVRQYWSSDPRPRLTLYRGANASVAKVICSAI
jgi:hypothetical protein